MATGMVKVYVAGSHPTGVRHRSGMKFTTAGVEIPIEKLTEAIKKDPYLRIEESKSAKAEPAGEGKK